MFKVLKKTMLFLLLFVSFLCSFSSQQTNSQFFCLGQTQRTNQVILGGQTIGISCQTRGLLVMACADYCDYLKPNDIIIAINNQTVNSNLDVKNLLKDGGKESVLLTIIRDGNEMTMNINPFFDLLTQKYVLGVWVKNEISGVGTLTYVNPNTGYFGSLGHPMLKQRTKPVEVQGGKVYSCNVFGIVKGKKGVPGELKGVMSRSKAYGDALKNSEHGVFGTINDYSFIENIKLVDVGGRKTIKPGKATIYCSLTDGKVEEYDIEIIKTNYQNVSNDKSLVFKVVDKDLISKTGGIVQGMSGSPIVQNGKLVGAVTHVFTNDSTKGFGVYIDWMM